MSVKLSKMRVLRAVAEAVRPRSIYIAEVLDMEHSIHVRNGGVGHSPTRGLLLARLRSLEADGLLACVGGPDGYYGYRWSITPAGRAALENTND